MIRYILWLTAIIILVIVIIYIIPKNDYASDDATLAQGKELFEKNCTSCHGLQEDGIGPPLGGVTKVLTKKALMGFISDPSHVIESGDGRALALYKKYKLVMPSFEWLKKPGINAILAYINYQTKLHHIEPVAIDKITDTTALTGRLVAPVKRSELKIELEDVIQLPQLGKSTDLGVVTLRAFPSGDGTLFASDQNGIIYRIKNGK